MQYREIFKVVKMKFFSRNIFYIFLIFAQNIDCGYTYPQSMFWSKGSSNKYPQSMFWSKNKNKNAAEVDIAPASGKIINQRTIGPENAHLKPDLGVLSHNEMTLTLNTHTPLLTS